MDRISLIVQSMILDAIGGSIMLAEGAIQIQRVLLDKAHDMAKQYAKSVARRIASSEATTPEEKREIGRIMEKFAGEPPLSEAELMTILAKMEELGLVEEVPPPGEDDPSATENSSVPLDASDETEERDDG